MEEIDEMLKLEQKLEHNTAKNSTIPTLEELLLYIKQAEEGYEPHNDIGYLKAHYNRFVTTFTLLKPRLGEKKSILDVGAHWLHQSLLYSLSGHRVFAADFPSTLEYIPMKKLAADNHITLIEYDSLENEAVFSVLRENEIDCVLFTDIIEHITFNPVSFWKEIYRVLSPGGKIVITTPNYYAAREMIGKFPRFFKGYGGGISMEEILVINTYGHHWKLYSAREIVKYFGILSNDFKLSFLDYFTIKNDSPPNPLNDAVISRLEGIFKKLRFNLYIEIELARKESGITAKPHWDL